MSASLFTHTSTKNATKVPIDLEAINFLLLGQNDIQMPFTNPPNKKTVVYYTDQRSPVKWFNDTYGKWYKYGADFKPTNITELIEELNSQQPIIMNQFFNLQGFISSTKDFIDGFEDDDGNDPNFTKHWNELKREFSSNSTGLSSGLGAQGFSSPSKSPKRKSNGTKTPESINYINIYNSYFDYIFIQLQKISSWDNQIDSTINYLIKNYYFGDNCPILDNDIKKNIKLLSIITYIRNNISKKKLIIEYHTLILIIKRQILLTKVFKFILIVSH